jgi:hypothetical protein
LNSIKIRIKNQEAGKVVESTNTLEECNVEIFLPSDNTACQEPEMPKQTSVREPQGNY